MSILDIDPSEPGPDTGFSISGLQRIRDDLDAEIAAANLPGAVVMLVRDGRPAFAYAAGYLDPVERTPMCLDALFRIYSMTKPLTSVAAMMLVERGALALADRIADHLPGMRAAMGETTVLHLLVHASGLTYGTRSNDATIRQAYEELGLAVNPRDLDAQRLLYGLARVPLLQVPGSSWEYGLSTDLLGVLVESVTGRRLGAWLQQHVFGPLGMVDTGFHVEPEQARRLAQPFVCDPVDGNPIAVPDQTFDATSRPQLDSGGAGAISSAGDYLRFALMLRGGGALDGVQLLQAATVQCMTRDHLAGHLAARVSPGMAAMLSPGYGFGLGFGVRLRGVEAELPGSPGFYFWSGTGGTMFWVDPVLQVAAVFMTQAPGLSRQHYRRWFVRRVYEALESR
jgi:CubicO group peptidase (beta-lactamase class C family)